MKVHEKKDLHSKILKHPLFQGVSEQVFQELIEECELRFYEKGESVLYSKTPREGLLLILTGMAEVFVEGDAGKREVLEVLQKGEMIGFSSLAHFLGEPETEAYQYTVEVEAVEASHCLKIPYSVVEKRWEDESVREFMLKQIAVRLRDIYASLAEQVKLAKDWGESEAFIRRVQDLMKQPVLTVKPGETVQNVAKTMVSHKASSVVVVDDDGCLVGIITEQDLVERVLALAAPSVLKAGDIMTEEPHTVSRYAYYYEALSTLYMNGVKHLPVIDERRRAVGIITLSGLLAKKNRGTMGILKTIEESTYQNIPSVKNAIYDVLSNLISDEISTTHTLEIITKLYDRLARHCVELAVKSLEEKGHGSPPVPFAWYQMGSGGRGEQFMLTDQDHFLVYKNPAKKDEEKVEQYFALLGNEIVHFLERAGYKRCQGLMMSSEENWRGTLSTWKSRLKLWALKSTNEHILLGHNFLSFRYLYGSREVNDDFVIMVRKQLEVSKTFIYLMAQQEREHPVPQLEQPLRALFRQKREVIDIKKHALFPLHHCLQILGVHYGIIEGTPLEILAELVKVGAITESFADDLRHAYEVALKTRIQMSWEKHLRGEKSTTEIKFASIRSWEREEIITALKSIRSLQFHLLKML